jgi:hypothetical protein
MKTADLQKAFDKRMQTPLNVRAIINGIKNNKFVDLREEQKRLLKEANVEANKRQRDITINAMARIG